MGPHETKYDGACRAIRTLVQQEEVTPSLKCVAHTNGASLWRAGFSGTHRPTSLNNPCQWMLPANLPPRKRWYRPRFEVLTHFGVCCTSTHSTVFKVDNSPSVGSQSLCVVKTAPLVPDLPVIPTLLTHQMMPFWQMFCRRSWTRMINSIGIFFGTVFPTH